MTGRGGEEIKSKGNVKETELKLVFGEHVLRNDRNPLLPIIAQ